MKNLYHHIIIAMMLLALNGCGMENFPNLQSVPHPPDADIADNNDNRPSIIIEQD